MLAKISDSNPSTPLETSSIRLQFAGEDLDECRFSDAVAPHQRYFFSGVKAQADAVEDNVGPEQLSNVVNLDNHGVGSLSRH